MHSLGCGALLDSKRQFKMLHRAFVFGQAGHPKMTW
jgi:hypothetical protein